jgi:outer membrane scaffolding protein for murein synthesis (MipA/OmpV family)
MGFQMRACVPGIRRRRELALRALEIAVAALAAGGVARAGDDSAIDGNSQAREYHLVVGPEIYSYPHYPGARGVQNLLFPFIDAEYANRFYTSASDLFGVYGYKTNATELGAALESDPTRQKVAGDPRLAGLPDVRQTSRLKLFASHTLGFVTGDMNVARDVEGRKQGTLGQANLWLTAPRSNILRQHRARHDLG